MDAPEVVTKKPVLLCAAAALGLILAGVGVWLGAWKFGGHPVHLANGLDTPYTATVNGTAVALPANGHAVVKVRQGRVTVQSTGPGVSIEDQSFDFSVPLIGARPTVVVNPDRVALLSHEGQQYSAHIAREYGSGQDLHPKSGELAYRLEPAADYFFEPFPAQVDAGKGAWRWRVAFNRGYGGAAKKVPYTPEEWLEAVGGYSGSRFASGGAALVDRRLAVEPGFAATLPDAIRQWSDLSPSNGRTDPVMKGLGYTHHYGRWLRGPALQAALKEERDRKDERRRMGWPD